ncbi:hypothetical protein B0H17DRAFT_1212057 [Mycena rosella]|uniref:Uncharacterized protein n=1 Tax=Mycena rosella TaxID=1033263 RepID=A0AAD7CWP9_MYCRO|nr:hypothetical protein B0H17DRAFT_1212057 [Mycena rosella]
MFPLSSLRAQTLPVIPQSGSLIPRVLNPAHPLAPSPLFLPLPSSKTVPLERYERYTRRRAASADAVPPILRSAAKPASLRAPSQMHGVVQRAVERGIPFATSSSTTSAAHPNLRSSSNDASSPSTAYDTPKAGSMVPSRSPVMKEESTSGGWTSATSACPEPPSMAFPPTTADDLVTGMVPLPTAALAHIDGLSPQSRPSTLPLAAPAFELSPRRTTPGAGQRLACCARLLRPAPALSRAHFVRVASAAGVRADTERAQREKALCAGLLTVVPPQVALRSFLAIEDGLARLCALHLIFPFISPASSLLPPSIARYHNADLHFASDTRPTEEDEGVLGCTEERGLITLGWASGLSLPSSSSSAVSPGIAVEDVAQRALRLWRFPVPSDRPVSRFQRGTRDFPSSKWG